jgi:hypothetical protein
MSPNDFRSWQTWAMASWTSISPARADVEAELPPDAVHPEVQRAVAMLEHDPQNALGEVPVVHELIPPVREPDDTAMALWHAQCSCAMPGGCSPFRSP